MALDNNVLHFRGLSQALTQILQQNLEQIGENSAGLVLTCIYRWIAWSHLGTRSHSTEGNLLDDSGLKNTRPCIVKFVFSLVTSSVFAGFGLYSPCIGCGGWYSRTLTGRAISCIIASVRINAPSY